MALTKPAACHVVAGGVPHGAGTTVAAHCSGDKKHEQLVSQLVHVGQLDPHVES